MTKLIIGIDPDLDKSGVAILSPSLDLKNLTFPEIVDLFRENQEQIKKVVVEAGWLNKKSNFHGAYRQSKSAGEAIARKVGENHVIGKKLVEVAKYYGLEVLEVKPTKTKKTAEQFNKITGWVGRSNQEQRDAAMLIWKMV